MADGTQVLSGIKLVRHDGVCEIVLNEPERRNPMSVAIMQGLAQACHVIEADRSEIGCAILTGTGTAFCAGGDLPYNDAHLKGEVESQRDFLELLYKPFLRILDLPVPTICAVNGAAVGGGVALAMLCDIRIMSERAKLVTAFSPMGFYPGLGLAYSLERLVGPSKVLELLYRGATVPADEAVSLGLASKRVAHSVLMEEARAMAAEITANSRFVNQLVKLAVREEYRGELRQRLERDMLAQVLTSVGSDYQQRRAIMTAKRAGDGNTS